MADWIPILRDANRRLSAELLATGASIWSADIGDRDLQIVGFDASLDLETPAHIRQALYHPDDILIRDRVYVVDGRRVCWARSYFDAEKVEGSRIDEFDTGPGGTPARLAELGLGLASFVEDVEFADDCDRDELHALRNHDSLAVTRILRRSATAEGLVVEVTDMRLVSSAYRFRWSWQQ